MRTFISHGVACAALSAGVLIASCGTASATTGSATTASATANLAKNGGFEVPVEPAGGFTLFSTGQVTWHGWPRPWRVSAAPRQRGWLNGDTTAGWWRGSLTTRIW
jgi:hypothetical protein